MSHFGLNLGQTAEDSEMFTNIWLSSTGLTATLYSSVKCIDIVRAIQVLHIAMGVEGCQISRKQTPKRFFLGQTQEGTYNLNGGQSF